VNRRLFAIAGLAALSACASLPRGAQAPGNAGFELLEPLSAVQADAAGVTIRVRSRGCTTRGDFAFYVEKDGPVPTLAFGRRRVDACSGPAEPMEIAFTWAELGLRPGEPVFVVNPLASAPAESP
jgi:hypothetical protein